MRVRTRPRNLGALGNPTLGFQKIDALKKARVWVDGVNDVVRLHVCDGNDQAGGGPEAAIE